MTTNVHDMSTPQLLAYSLKIHEIATRGESSFQTLGNLLGVADELFKVTAEMSKRLYEQLTLTERTEMREHYEKFSQNISKKTI